MSATAPIGSASAPTRTRALLASPVFGSARGDLIAAGVLSAVAGYVDAAGFLGLYGLYAAHVTGDLVAAGTTVAGGFDEGMLLRLSALFVFMISVASAALVTRAAHRRRQKPLTALFALLTISLALFCAAGVLLRPQLKGPGELAVLVTSALGVFGMGVQNALMKDVLCSLGATTLMTGNLTQMTMDLVNVLLPDDQNGPSMHPSVDRRSRRVDLHRQLVKSSTAVFAFLLGTVLGGVAITVFAFWSIALPAAAAAALTLVAWHQSRTGENRGARTPRPIAPRALMPKRISGIQEIEPMSRTWPLRARGESRAANGEK